MSRKNVFKAIIGTAAGLFLGLSAVAFAHNGFQGNQRGPGMMGQPCPWNTTTQGTHGPMHNQAFHQQMHGMMYSQGATPGQMRGPGGPQGAPCGLNPQCPAAQASTDTTTP